MTRLLLTLIFTVLSLCLFGQKDDARQDTINSVIVYKKDKTGSWIPQDKYDYTYEPNRSEELESSWVDGYWEPLKKRIRTNSINLDSITRTSYKWENSEWKLDRKEFRVYLKEFDGRFYYESSTAYFEKRMIERMIRREKRGLKNIKTSSISIDKVDYLLKLEPPNYIAGLIYSANKSVDKGEKLKTFKPLRCGHSRPISFDLFYDELDRVELFIDLEIKGRIFYMDSF